MIASAGDLFRVRNRYSRTYWSFPPFLVFLSLYPFVIWSSTASARGRALTGSVQYTRSRSAGLFAPFSSFSDFPGSGFPPPIASRPVSAEGVVTDASPLAASSASRVATGATLVSPAKGREPFRWLGGRAGRQSKPK